MSKKIIVSLISEQTIPNFEFIKEKIKEIEALLFITTPSMEKSGNREWILKALGDNDLEVLDPILVNAFSFEDIEEKLAQSINDEDLYLVNLTGGTKIMSLAVYDFFKSVNSQMFYLTGRGQYIKIHPGRTKPVFNLKSKTSLTDYMIAYGFEITNKSTPLYSFDQSNQLLKYFLNHFDKENDPEILEELRNGRSKGIKNIETIKNLSSFLNKLNIKPQAENKLSKYECRYLSGDWLEEYLYYFLLNELNISDFEIGLGWNVEKNGNQNEFDVLVMRNNKLYLFECKTSIYLDAEENWTFISDIIYKSDSLRNQLGLFAQSIVFTLSDLEKPKLKSHIERAQASRVNLIGLEEISNESRLYDYLKNL